jgi:hypothetical protein
MHEYVLLKRSQITADYVQYFKFTPATWKGKLAETSEERQGTRRVVEPMMMMMNNFVWHNVNL